MLLRAVFTIVFAGLPVSFAAAQDEPLRGGSRAGHQLFTQSCGICHLKPQITSARFGPQLSHQIVAGKEEGIRRLIQTGLPDMPGFRHELTPVQIDLIIAYLATLPDPAQPDLGVHGQSVGEHAEPDRAMPSQGAMR